MANRVHEVLDEDLAEELGEPVASHRRFSSETPWNVEFAQFTDPETRAMSAPSFNMSSDLYMEYGGEDEDQLHEKIQDFVEDFRSSLSEKDENPVFASDDVISMMDGEDEIPAYMVFDGLDEVYPVTVRRGEVLQDRLRSSRFVTNGYEDVVEDALDQNNFVVPVLYTEDGLPDRMDSSILRQTGSEIAASPDDPAVSQYFDGELEEPEEAETPDYMDTYDMDGGRELLVDLTAGDMDRVEAELTGEEVIVYGDGDIVYREKVDAGELEESQRNNVYQARAV
ncbi:MAG: hypothetical protein ABEK01_01015 [Candidatus Nanohaloarchaea archaeon]